MGARYARGSAAPRRAVTLAVLALALAAAVCAALLVRDAMTARDAMTRLRLEVPATHAAARGEGAGRPGTLEVWSTPTTTSGGLLTAGVPVCG
jgi:hypothetical protein